MRGFEDATGPAQPHSQLHLASCDVNHDDLQVRTRNEVLLPSFQHGVGDPVEDSIVVATHHTLVLVEGNYLLIGAPACGSLPFNYPPATQRTAKQDCRSPGGHAVREMTQLLHDMPCCADALSDTAPSSGLWLCIALSTFEFRSQMSRRGTSSRTCLTTPGTSTAMWIPQWSACTIARWLL